MERDFLGLNWKKPVRIVEEFEDNYKESGVYSSHHLSRTEEPIQGTKYSNVRESVIPWRFSNKISIHPQLRNFKASQEERQRKITVDHNPSSCVHSVPTLDFIIFRPLSIATQLSDVNGFPAKRAHEKRPFQVSDHSLSPLINNSFIKTPIGSSNVGPDATNVLSEEHALCGIAISASSTRSFISRNVSKTSSLPSQMTIFYAGEVHVFNEISTEMAQEIMSLAACMSFSTQRGEQQFSSHKPTEIEDYMIQSHINSHCSESPVSIASHSLPQCGSVPNNDETMSFKSVEDFPNTVQHHASEPAFTMAFTVPQARKASLARFLEKRKQRILNTAPYCRMTKSLTAS